MAILWGVAVVLYHFSGEGFDNKLLRLLKAVHILLLCDNHS